MTTKFLTKISMATLSAALALASAPVALQAQTTTSTTTPTTSSCTSGCIIGTTFGAGGEAETLGRAAVVGGSLVNGQIVATPGTTYEGGGEVDGYSDINQKLTYSGQACGLDPCVATTLEGEAEAGQYASSWGFVHSTKPGDTAAVMGGTSAKAAVGLYVFKVPVVATTVP